MGSIDLISIYLSHETCGGEKLTRRVRMNNTSKPAQSRQEPMTKSVALSSEYPLRVHLLTNRTRQVQEVKGKLTGYSRVPAPS